MPSYKVGQEIVYNNETVTIVEIIKGRKLNKPNMQSGVMFTGYKSNPCTYVLSNGNRVRGITIKKQQQCKN